VGLVGEEELPPRGRTGGRRWWPPRLPVPTRGGSVGEVDMSVSFSSWDRGGERLSWLSGGSAPDLAVAGSGGGHSGTQERERGLTQDAKGSDPFMGVMRACLRPKDRR
jgi:hypothetical protein